MKTLFLTIGLPRSGKSTWARTTGNPIVNPDSIRLALHGKRFEPLAEPFVWATAQVMVRALFLAGHDKVILDATNTTGKRRDAWASDTWTTTFVYIPTSEEECLLRAHAVEDYEIIPIIKKMAAEFTLPLYYDTLCK